jgi:redox-sensitive bicupin YhaK (pirin superfamily)
MKSQIFLRADRGVKDLGWLKSNFYFSFSDYYDPTKSAFGTLLALNDDTIEVGKGFGTHPHVDMEIISVILSGSMSHKDSMGYDTVVNEGSVQIMTAGSGLYHEEWNVGEEDVHFLQIWIQPKLHDIRPRYQTRSFPRAGRVDQLKTIVSHEEGLEHCWINQNAKLNLGYYSKDTELKYELTKTNKCVFILCIQGSVAVGDVRLEHRDAIGVWDASEIDIHCSSDTELLIIETVINQK